jgi:hypothetical protein
MIFSFTASRSLRESAGIQFISEEAGGKRGYRDGGLSKFLVAAACGNLTHLSIDMILIDRRRLSESTVCTLRIVIT